MQAGLVATAVLLLASPTAGDVVFASVFGDHMVLQRDRDLKLWGTADPRESVTIVFGTQIVSTTADVLGRWEVVLGPLAASSQPRQLLAHGKENTTRISDVVVGEVWLCSGQSNMGWPLSESTGGAEAIATADRPDLRWLDLVEEAEPNAGPFTEAELSACRPEKFFRGSWTRSTPSTAGTFSAVAYHFGARLAAELGGVPVGLVHNAVGGSPTEAWIRGEVLAEYFNLRTGVGRWVDNDTLHPWCRERAADNLSGWMNGVLAASNEGTLPPDTPGHPFQPGFLFEAGVAPLVDFEIRGIVWYQGESNGHDPGLYRALMATLITDWRALFGDPTMSFLQVQLPGMGTSGGYQSELWPELREAQRNLSRDLVGVDMAITIELGHPTDVHPRDKAPVGHRLARLALAKTYGRTDMVAGGPLLRAHMRGEGRILLYFERTGAGLVASDDSTLRGFEVAGPDGAFHPAKAEIQAKDLVRVWSDTVSDPRVVRYAFAPLPDGNLANEEGLPASPFVTGD